MKVYSPLQLSLNGKIAQPTEDTIENIADTHKVNSCELYDHTQSLTHHPQQSPYTNNQNMTLEYSAHG